MSTKSRHRTWSRRHARALLHRGHRGGIREPGLGLSARGTSRVSTHSTRRPRRDIQPVTCAGSASWTCALGVMLPQSGRERRRNGAGWSTADSVEHGIEVVGLWRREPAVRADCSRQRKRSRSPAGAVMALVDAVARGDDGSFQRDPEEGTTERLYENTGSGSGIVVMSQS